MTGEPRHSQAGQATGVDRSEPVKNCGQGVTGLRVDNQRVGPGGGGHPVQQELRNQYNVSYRRLNITWGNYFDDSHVQETKGRLKNRGSRFFDRAIKFPTYLSFDVARGGLRDECALQPAHKEGTGQGLEAGRYIVEPLWPGIIDRGE